MSENSIPHTLVSFLRDLVEIREKNGVSLDDIRARTKVYPHIIAQFEQDGLNEHPLFNVLYLKAFVRSYAEVVGISPDMVVGSYVDALKGAYDRRLAVTYLGHAPYEEISLSDADVVEKNVEKATDEPVTEAVASKPSALKETRKRQGSVAFKSAQSMRPDRPKSALQDATRIATDYWEKAIQFVGNKGMLQWGVLAVCIGLLGFLLIKLVTVPGESIPTLASQEPILSVQETSVTNTFPSDDTITELDSLQLAKANRIQDILGRISNGDSLFVTVVASSDKLDPFRAKVDRDLRRPYWLDQGDSLSFWFSEQITIEDDLDKMEILFESLSYPITETDSTARVIINRDSASQFVYAVP